MRKTFCGNTYVALRIDRRVGRRNVSSLPEGVLHPRRHPADKAGGSLLKPSGDPWLHRQIYGDAIGRALRGAE